jgi:hypothetical protein
MARKRKPIMRRVLDERFPDHLEPWADCVVPPPSDWAGATLRLSAFDFDDDTPATLPAEDGDYVFVVFAHDRGDVLHRERGVWAPVATVTGEWH